MQSAEINRLVKLSHQDLVSNIIKLYDIIIDKNNKILELESQRDLYKYAFYGLGSQQNVTAKNENKLSTKLTENDLTFDMLLEYIESFTK